MTRIGSRIFGLAAVVALVLIATMILRFRNTLSSASFPPSKRPDAMERYFSGLIATDCGRVSLRGSPSAATNCAINAFRKKEAFFVRYDLQGVDSNVATGIASEGDGRLYELAYDSMGDILTTKSCPRPIKLIMTGGGWLTCVPIDSAR